MLLKNRNISSKIKRSKVTDYAALSNFFFLLPNSGYNRVGLPLKNVLESLLTLNELNPEDTGFVDI